MSAAFAPVMTHPQADLSRTERYFFRRRVNYSGGAARVCIYADTRYRLFVGGKLVTTGPVRSVPWARPMFDTIDLAPHLAMGEQFLVVEVLCQRANNFQAMPGTPGGLAVFGQVGGVGEEGTESLAMTDGGGGRGGPGRAGGGWGVMVDPAWHYPTPHHSFAQGPTEVCDLRLRSGDPTKGEGSSWVTPVPVGGGKYAALAPADLPLPSMAAEGFASGVDLGLSTARELRVATSIAAKPGAAGGEAYKGGVRPTFAWATFVYSPEARSVEAGIFWGPNSLNGEGLKQSNDPLRGNRQNATLNLKAGWNLLFGAPEFMGPVWGVTIAVPQGLGLEFRAEPEMECGDAMRITETMPPDVLSAAIGEKHPAGKAELEALQLEWTRVSRRMAAPLPARDVAWDTYDPASAERWDARSEIGRDLRPGEVWSVVADFGTEYLGLHEAEVTVPADTTVDIAYEERTRADGAVQLFSSNPFCDMAERFTLPAGRHVLSPCQPRGGRVVQVTFRAAVGGGGGRAVLHGLRVRDVKRVVASPAVFSSGNTLLAWAYNTSKHTIERTLEDGYVDPWRERGLYLGDAYVAGLSHLCLTPDVRHVSHSLRLFAEGQREDGQFPGVVPAYLREPHEDFSLIYVDFVRQYAGQTGDLATAAAVYPAIGRMLSGSRWKRAESGLWNTSGGRVFLDWGVDPAMRTADENACINALRYRALVSAAELAMTLGKPGEARSLAEQAAEVREAFNRRLWGGDAAGFWGGFVPKSHVTPEFSEPKKDGPPALSPGTPLTDNTVHVNLLALFSGVVWEERVPALLAVVERQMSVNAHKCKTQGPHSGMAELYFLRFAVEGLSRVGRVGLALQVLLQHFAVMRDLKLVTLPEAIHRAVMNKDSLCHCWGGWPVEFVTRRLLGITLEHPNDPGRVRVAPSAHCPRPTTLTCPVGVGLVQVSLGLEKTTVTLTGLAGGVYVGAGGERVELKAGVNVVG